VRVGARADIGSINRTGVGKQEKGTKDEIRLSTKRASKTRKSCGVPVKDSVFDREIKGTGADLLIEFRKTSRYSAMRSQDNAFVEEG